MTLPEDSDSLNIRQDIDGDGNQVIAKMTGDSKAVGSGRDVIFEQHNHIYPVKERTTFLFQLPLSADDFTGRQKELDLIYTALNKSGQSGTVVISAVSGMAGVGKSALAVYAAHQMAERFPDAQLYVNLQGADAKPTDPNDVLGEWLRDLGMDGAEIPMAQAEREKCYRSLLAGKRVLILLDNAHDAAQVKPLLPGSGKCAVILTSRRLLSELVGTQPIPLDPLEDEDALKLLAKLAGEERVAAEPQAAEEIVRLCGYLPLAVRIAGGVLKGKRHWGLGADYLPRLADERGRLDELTQVQGEDVRASFNLSYRQLDEVERRLFGLLGVLEGNFGLWLAAAVSEMEVAAAKESVERLIDAQLVEITQQGRYQYHDLMRLYARDWLSADERQTVAENAFGWYWGGANYFENAFDPQRRRKVAAERYGEMAEKEREDTFYQEALSWFEVERPHLLAAFEWGYAQKRHSEIVSFTGNLTLFFQARSYWQDWVHTHELALVSAKESDDKRGESQTLNNLGLVYRAQGRWEEAIAQYEQSLEIYRSLGDRHGEGQTLNNLGVVYRSQGRWEDATAQYEQSLEICRSLGDRHGEGQTLGNLGVVYESQGRWEDAIAQYEQSLEIYRSLGDRHGEGQTLNNLGLVYQSQGRWEDAIALYEQDLEICRSLGDRHGEGTTLNNLGNVYQSQGRWEDAIALYEQDLEICRSLGDRHGEGQSLMGLGVVYRSQGRWEDAIAQYEQSLEIKRSLGDRHGEGITLMNLGNLYSARAQYAKAIEYWQAAQTKLHPDSPEAKQIAQKLQQPYPIRQMVTGGLIWLTVLAFIIFNLLRGHWLIAALTLLAFAAFFAYRLWKLRRGKR